MLNPCIPMWLYTNSSAQKCSSVQFSLVHFMVHVMWPRLYCSRPWHAATRKSSVTRGSSDRFSNILVDRANQLYRWSRRHKKSTRRLVKSSTTMVNSTNELDRLPQSRLRRFDIVVGELTRRRHGMSETWPATAKYSVLTELTVVDGCSQNATLCNS